MLGGAEPKDYELALRLVLEDPGVDLAIPILVPQALVNPEQVASAIVAEAKKATKPVVACFMGNESIAGARKILHENQVPMLDYPEKIGSVCGGLWQYAGIKNGQKIQGELKLTDIDKEKVKKYFADHKNQKIFGEAEARFILGQYGIPLVKGEIARNKDEAVEIGSQIGFPVVLKIASPDFLHKSDVKGIAVGLKDGEQVAAAWDEIMQKTRLANPQAVIQGCMVEKMAKPGREVILGMKRDPNFGALMMFGLGGIFVELYKDVSFRVAPLSRAGCAGDDRGNQGRCLVERIQGRTGS